ncbi:MAG: ATP synthase F0 subunit C [Thermodesulfobacteriota bacterium]|jgi:F-type H+-transporting ATPase subunit c|nr:ATP synthase F0 subunit C [Thermodesulfobacteriota bacterium]|tara:strand:- start:426 stop:740 length:315 start_codon:yes stop_codon:yes gene_type:complete
MKRFSFYTFFVSALVLLLAPELLAADQSGEAISGLALGSGIGIGIAAAGGGVGMGRMVASALDAVGRNPGAAGQIQTPMIIGLALIESLVIYALAITFLLQNKI